MTKLSSTAGMWGHGRETDFGKRGTEGIRNSRCGREEDARMKHEAGAEGRLGERQGRLGLSDPPRAMRSWQGSEQGMKWNPSFRSRSPRSLLGWRGAGDLGLGPG